MSDVSLISDYKEELADVQAAMKAMLTNGQKHTLNGSHSFEGVSYRDLARRETQLKNALAALNGGKSYTIPDFS